MKHLSQNLIAFLLLFTLLALSCKDAEPEKEAFIRVPFPDLDPEYTDFTFTAEEGGTFSIESGTTLSVPSDIWQNAAGENVTGNITLKYREFHDALDIFLSGTTLNYDTAGTQEVLTTAGMFELRAFKDSNEIFIKPDKSLEVKMASYKSDSDFNFYSLDEEAGNWQYAGRTEPEINPKLKEITDSISKLKSTETLNLKGSKMFALNYNAVLDIYFRNRRINRESKAPKRKAEKYGLAYSSINGYQDVYFRGRKYQAWEMVWELENANRLASWTKKGAYIDKLTALGNNSYYMKVKSGNDKSITYKVKALMPLKVLFATSPERWQQEYEQVLERIDEEQRRLEAQAEVFRIISINNTGLYNWDKLLNREEQFLVQADYNFTKALDTEIADYDVYYFMNNNQSLIRYKLRVNDTITMVPDSSSALLVVTSPQEAAFCRIAEDTDDFETIRKKGMHTFNMKTIEINSKDDLLSVLGK
jgi:hypothetical protein